MEGEHPCSVLGTVRGSFEGASAFRPLSGISMNPTQSLLWLRRLSSLRWTAFLFAILCVEVLWGTVVQIGEGQWEAHRRVFGNWLGGVPFLCALASINLSAALVARVEWRWRDGGFLAAHVGVLAVLLSGVVGSALSKTSYMELSRGESAFEGGVPSDWELVLQYRKGARELVRTRDLEDVVEGIVLDFGGAGRATVAGYVSNGVIGVDQSPIALPRGKDPSNRVPAIALDFASTDGTSPVRIALDGNRPIVTVGRTATFILRRAVRPLPFGVHLVEFDCRDHRGNHAALPCRSKVAVTEPGGGRRIETIDGDHPMRIGPFTIYQASWRVDERTGIHRSILSVVENPMGAMPYWASLLVVVGLGLHLLLLFADKVPALLRQGWWDPWSLGHAPLGLVGILVVAWRLCPEGESLPGLIDSLGTDFRRSVHLLVVSAGYAGIVAAGAAAHWHLNLARIGREDGGSWVRGPLAVGLVLTAAGMLLGGNLAEQGLGRFWGWDPQGNGALVIVLWAAMLFHGRLAGWIGPRGFSVGAILSIATVLFARFGVDLLRDEDPSGAGSAIGTAASLSIYSILETAFLVWVLLWKRFLLFLRGFRLWRIRYVRSRNPRLRRHGDTGGWGE